MVRAHLEDLPDFAPPAGWSLRRFQAGDEANWRRIHLAAEKQHAITPDLFRRQFGDDARLLNERQYYLLHPCGAAVGTATAWFDDTFQGGGWGRVHWVAMLPAYQGQGLGRPLMSAVCRRLRELGHGRAFLRTAATRIPAIRLYRQFGFEPFLPTAAEAAVWREVLARLDRRA